MTSHTESATVSMMTAAWYERIGDARNVIMVGSMKIPEVKPGEVRVHVHASGVNPSDTKFRSGWGGLKLQYPRVIPHNDGAGVVEAVGEGVSPNRLGERVWIYEAQRGRPFGTAAQYVVVPSQNAVPLPEQTDFIAGACLGVPAMTAHHCVFKDGVVTGQTILVAGGAGAVGNYAIQLAKWGGATVITTVSSPAKAELAQRAGADHILNYKTEDVVSCIKALMHNRGVDRVIEVDFGANLATNLKVLKTDGIIATYASDTNLEPAVPIYSLIYKNLTVHYVLVYAMSESAHQAAAADITTCLKTGVLYHPIAQRFPLDQTATAHHFLESGEAIGNVIIDIAE